MTSDGPAGDGTADGPARGTGTEAPGGGASADSGVDTDSGAGGPARDVDATDGDPPPEALLTKRLAGLDVALAAMARAGSLGGTTRMRAVLDGLRLVMREPGGTDQLRARTAAIEASGIFEGTDWAEPRALVAGLSRGSLRSPDRDMTVLELASDIRLMAVAAGEYEHPGITADEAREHLSQVLAANSSMLFSAATEAERVQAGAMAPTVRTVLRHIGTEVGFGGVLDELVEEIWRILRQRPVQVEPVVEAITEIAAARADTTVDTSGGGVGADRLISSLFGPTEGCRDDPGLEVYRQRLESMDDGTLQYEATGFARSMHDTGLVSQYHAVLVRFLRESPSLMLAEVLGLSSTGRESLLCYNVLVEALIDEAVWPETAQCLYGLALLLERGILFQSPVAPSLWRQLALPLCDHARSRLEAAYGTQPDANRRLLAGALSVLGQPLGVGQGDNPTCQSARAISMWAYNDPDYLLQAIAWAARDDELVMHFEGQPLSSRDSAAGVAATLPIDLDPVSLLVVPHLDRIYAEMVRRCAGREGDPHRWINPEFHGWWADRGFAINVDVATGRLTGLDGFLRHFYGSYHPLYNGNQPLIHPQPAGIAVTDSSARFVGWHAITVLRVAMDPDEAMRVYFYNPNNDSGQDWGDGVVVSTAGHSERFGEGSLPFEQFASRLYIYHFDAREQGDSASVAAYDIEGIVGLIERSWGADRLPEIAAEAE